ncbi:MAG: UDP-glucose/GDP-mannose dehydrogenase family protein, partial [Bacteroidetes bacterium]|nr:UDP-glucose/GDP-mannose dehydrogenase family protein [Bacteroidota bacterium]
MNVSIFGLGYVGIVNMACLSKLGHKVYGCDIKSQKVDLITQGKSPNYEPEVDELIAAGHKDGSIQASTNAELVISETDIALICVGTPSRENGSVNLNYIINTTIEIAAIVKKISKPLTIAYRSTIPPGTIEDVIIPELARILGDDKDIVSIAFLPEFLREGSAVKDFFNGSRIVIGNNTGNIDNLKELFSYNENTPVIITNLKTAEYVKYVDNAYHAVKVAFANEAYTIGAAYGINVKKANEIFLMDNQLNISPYYLKPGLPFGGSCLPKDIRAINMLATKKGITSPLLGNVLASNKAIQNQIATRIHDLEIKNITMFGLTFKDDTDDVRESPSLQVIKELLLDRANLHVYDPVAMEHVKKIFPHLNYTNNAQDAVDKADIVLLLTEWEE